MLPRVVVSTARSSDCGVEKPTKRCGVCSDIAKSFHFGGLACDSCKAFFRRSVQNEAFRAFRCAFRGRCDITVQSRKCCQYCRFHKCSSIGMEIGWVMTEEERMDMLRTRMEKKLQRRSNISHIYDGVTIEEQPCKKRKLQVRVHQRRRDVLKSRKSTDDGIGNSSPIRQDEPIPEADDGSPPEDAHRSPPIDGHRWSHSPIAAGLMDADQNEIENLTRTFGLWFNSTDQKCQDQWLDSSREKLATPGLRKWGIRPPESQSNEADGDQPEWLLALLFMISIQKLVKFARGIRRFSTLSTKDQMNLLRANVFEMFLAVHFHERGASCLYPECHRENEPAASDSPSVGRESSKDGYSSGDGEAKETHHCPFLMSVDEGLAYGRRFSALLQDAPTLVLLLAVILFCPDSASASWDKVSASVIESCRMHFCRLLDARLTARFGPEKRAILFPSLLLLLPTLREIRDKRLFYRFDIGRKDLDAAYSSL